jgi:hypothetical protein
LKTRCHSDAGLRGLAALAGLPYDPEISEALMAGSDRTGNLLPILGFRSASMFVTDFLTAMCEPAHTGDATCVYIDASFTAVKQRTLKGDLKCVKQRLPQSSRSPFVS